MHADHPAVTSVEGDKSAPATDPQESPSADCEQWINRAEACELFEVSSRTWSTWVREGRVPQGRLGRTPSGHSCRLYPLKVLYRLKQEWERTAQPYHDPDHPGAWRVPLNGKGPHRDVLVDTEDLPLVQGRSRCWAVRSDGTGGIVLVRVDGEHRPLHRLILGVSDQSERVSFANGNPLDCRRANLCVRTQAEVAYSARPPKMRGGKARTSQYKGVGFDRSCGKWRAVIKRGTVQATIGTFDDEAAAAKAFDDCARLWYGEHAYLNYPDRCSTQQDRVRAQDVLDKVVERGRRRERRCKKLEHLLRHAAREGESEGTKVAATATPEAFAVVASHEARRLLSVPPEMWSRWEKRGWIPSGRRVGGRLVYPVVEMRRLLEACGQLRPPYPDLELANVWRVPLVGRGFFGKEALIDSSSLPLIEGGWCTMSGSKQQVSDQVREGAYVSLWSPAVKRHLPLRRLIAGVKDEGFVVGHRNDDPLDCRRANLVVMTPRQRSFRKCKIKSVMGKPTTSEFKGVSWNKNAGKWIAMISRDGTVRYLGLYERELDAARAYDRAARELFGPHAYLNFPPAGRDAPGRLAA